MTNSREHGERPSPNFLEWLIEGLGVGGVRWDWGGLGNGSWKKIGEDFQALKKMQHHIFPSILKVEDRTHQNDEPFRVFGR